MLPILLADNALRRQAPVYVSTERRIGDDLTGRERDVLQLVVRGLNNRQIAAKLTIATTTVKTHLRRIYRKLETHSRAQTIECALRHRLAFGV